VTAGRRGRGIESTGRIEKAKGVVHGSGLDVTIGEADVRRSIAGAPCRGEVIVDRFAVTCWIALPPARAERSDRVGYAIP
jgi:hypothetical protein